MQPDRIYNEIHNAHGLFKDFLTPYFYESFHHFDGYLRDAASNDARFSQEHILAVDPTSGRGLESQVEHGIRHRTFKTVKEAMEYAVDAADRGERRDFSIAVRGNVYVDDFSTRRPRNPEGFSLEFYGVGGVNFYFQRDDSKIDVTNFNLILNNIAIIDMRERPNSALFIVSNGGKLTLNKVWGKSKISTLVRCAAGEVEMWFCGFVDAPAVFFQEGGQCLIVDSEFAKITRLVGVVTSGAYARISGTQFTESGTVVVTNSSRLSLENCRLLGPSSAPADDDVVAIAAENDSEVCAKDVWFEKYAVAVQVMGAGSKCNAYRCDVRSMKTVAFHSIEDATLDVSNTKYDDEIIFKFTHYRQGRYNLENCWPSHGVMDSSEDQTAMLVPGGACFYI